MEQLLQIRSRISQAVEKPQKAGEIGSALEAKVVLGATPAEMAVLEPVAAEAEEIFILSDLEIRASGAPECTVAKTPNARCERCWRYRPEVGKSAAHPTLCARCEGALG
jgi:isoleucyl-tRNA synthetase